MKTWLKEEIGPWLSYTVRVIILKQWKRPKTICGNLVKLRKYLRSNIPAERIRDIAEARHGWYRRTKLPIVISDNVRKLCYG